MELKKNVIYSSVLTSSNYIFQFITYPYVARILGVTNIGICNYIQCIVQYYIIFSMLGITTLGVREIAKCNGNKKRLNLVFSQLFSINFGLTMVVLVVYIIMVQIVPQFAPYRKLLYIGASQILFNLFTVEWLFRGIENFKYITIRTLVIRSIYVASIFLFIHNEEDYIKYFTIWSGVIIANGIVNWGYSRKIVSLTFQTYKSTKQFIKPILYLGTQQILTSFYTTFNVVYLGIVCGATQVGFYTTATKIENIILALYSSFTMVMMPRISAMIEKRDDLGVRHLIHQSTLLLFAFVTPCIIMTEFYAKEIVLLIAGKGYDGAIFPMRLVMPLMLIVGLEQILIVQILLPYRFDKQIFISSIMGASFSIIVNLLIVPHLRSIGSAIAWFTSEVVVMVCAMYFVRRRFDLLTICRDLFYHLFAFLPLIILFYYVTQNEIEWYFKLGVGIIITLLYSHFTLLYIIKNEAYQMCIKSIAIRFYGNKHN
jgi:O-antigen/teichoic acid export membrane protein